MSRAWALGGSVLAMCCALSGCGGRAREDAPALAAAVGGASGASGALGKSGAVGAAGGVSLGSEGGASGAAGAGTSGAASLVAQGCPDPAQQAACQHVQLDLDFTKGGSASAGVQVLQLPDYGMPVISPYVDPPDASLWDRSALPAGACVFRVHAALSGCLYRGELFEQPCAQNVDIGVPGVAPGNFYETGNCQRSIAPGCPSSDPWLSNGVGNWWYAVPRGADSDIVICAPECAAIVPVGHACLSL